MPAVVSDTSPLVYLTRLGHFSWLRKFYGEVLIPTAVWDESQRRSGELPESAATAQAVRDGWMRVETPTLHGALLIIDEAEGRAVATALGLKVTGTLGLIVEAKARGLISSVRIELNRLVSETTFFLSDDVREFVLRLANEKEDSK